MQHLAIEGRSVYQPIARAYLKSSCLWLRVIKRDESAAVRGFIKINFTKTTRGIKGSQTVKGQKWRRI